MVIDALTGDYTGEEMLDSVVVLPSFVFSDFWFVSIFFFRVGENTQGSMS